MNTDRGGRYSVLSIYLPILTIIVLISIRGGREVQGASDDSNLLEAAALLVTEDFLSEMRDLKTETIETGSRVDKRIKGDTSQGKPNSTRVKLPDSGTHLTAIIVDNVRYKVATEKMDGVFKDGWMEIKPGRHDIAVEWETDYDYVERGKRRLISGDETGDKKKWVGEHESTYFWSGKVYELSIYSYFSGTSIPDRGSTAISGSVNFIYLLSIKPLYCYNHNLGVVMDLTDSKFAFKIK